MNNQAVRFIMPMETAQVERFLIIVGHRSPIILATKEHVIAINVRRGVHIGSISFVVGLNIPERASASFTG